jgi:polyketide synthase PksN
MFSREMILSTVKDSIVKETRYDPAELKDDSLFEEIGLESVMMVSIIDQLEKTFGELPKTLFFEYQTKG